MLAVAAAVTAALALNIYDEDLATSRVFSSGFDGASVRNALPGFVGTGCDLSSTGWITGTGLPNPAR